MNFHGNRGGRMDYSAKGLYNRNLLFPCDARLVKNPTKAGEYKDDENFVKDITLNHLGDVFNFFVQGIYRYHELLEQGIIAPKNLSGCIPESMRKAMDKEIDSQNKTIRFFHENLEFNKDTLEEYENYLESVAELRELEPLRVTNCTPEEEEVWKHVNDVRRKLEITKEDITISFDELYEVYGIWYLSRNDSKFKLKEDTFFNYLAKMIDDEYFKYDEELARELNTEDAFNDFKRSVYIVGHDRVGKCKEIHERRLLKK